MSGPFGNYNRGSVGHVLNCMYDVEKVPLMKVENVQIDFVQAGEGRIFSDGKVVGYFQYFDGIEQALFRWSDKSWWENYSRQHMAVDDDGQFVPMFRLTLTVHNTPGFEISGDDATEELGNYLRYPMLTNVTDHECYELHKAAGAFFQGGSNNLKGEWFMIEFWKPAGAQAWVDYLNKNYRPGKTIYSEK